MTKTRLTLLLAAACWITNTAWAQMDAPGVTVSMNGATVMHRTMVNYPAAARQQGVEGTVTVQVKLDATGNVSDAQVLSGPEGLRKPVLESVLQWHFTHDAASSTRSIQVAFEAPKTTAATAGAPVAAANRETVQVFASSGGMQPLSGRISSIRVVGLPDAASAELLAGLPVHEGDEIGIEAMQRLNQTVKAFDEHLSVQTSRREQTPSGGVEIGLVIAAPGAPFVTAASSTAVMTTVPGAIRVDGAAQSALIVKKVAPVYPELAKTARVSGVVHLAVVIAPEGTMQEVHSLGGPALLIQAAMDAVRQWVYRPSATPVQTTVDVNFTLNQ